MRATILVENTTKSTLACEWGLSIYLEYRNHILLLDTGSSGAFAENATALGLDLGRVEALILSHAHYDHTDGMEVFFTKNTSAKAYLRNGAAENCYSREEQGLRYVGIRPGTLGRFAPRFCYQTGVTTLFPGAFLLPHSTPGLEQQGQAAGLYIQVGDELRPDDFAHEQSLVLETENGLVIFNSCCHGGADVVIQEAARAFPGKQIHALVGGLHLFESSEEQVRELAEKLRHTGVERIYTGHCTGEQALAILQQELGERVLGIHSGMVIRIPEGKRTDLLEKESIEPGGMKNVEHSELVLF